MAFVNISATSVKIPSDISEDEDRGSKDSEQRNLSSTGKSSSEIVLSVKEEEPVLHKSYRQFKCQNKWWRKAVIYEVYVRSFFDFNNDGIGDLKGIEEKLDYFKYLGVNTLWLTPFFPSPMVDFGYDISDFNGIDPIFGTMEDFKKLLRRMKDAEMKIILDFVPNHTSDQHDWFKRSILQEHPYTDYYVWRSPKGFDVNGQPIPPNNWKSVFRGSAWEYNPLVIQEMINVMNFWLELGVDGFRLDAAPHLLEDEEFRDNPPAVKDIPNGENFYTEEDYCFWDHVHTCNCSGVLDILASFRNVCDQWSIKDGNERVLMTEGYLPLPALMEYYGTANKPIAHFSFNFELLNLQRGCTALDVFNCITTWLDALPEHCWPNWQTGNHDQPRIASKLGEEFVDLMNILLLMLPGTAMTYYGEEIGMKNTEITWEQTVDPAGRNAGSERYQLFSRDPERSPMQWTNDKSGFSKFGIPWLPLNTDLSKVNVRTQKESDRSHLKTYKTLISLRESKAWQNGNIDIRVLCAGSVLAFTRVDNLSGESLLVIENFSNLTVSTDFTDFDHVPQRENSLVVVAVSHLLEGYKEGTTFSGKHEITLSGFSGLVCTFNAYDEPSQKSEMTSTS